jgi:peptidyl-prolyl cis-trans isomerase B (cyclophilin B)
MLGSKGLWIAVLAAVALLVAGAAFAAAPAAKAKVKHAARAAGNPDEVGVLETSKGRMVVEFWPNEAPKTVANFKKLARSGFYNGTGFHRIIAGFMIQGGDPKSKNPKAPDIGTGGPGWTVPAEFNSHKHVKGVLSMARGGDPNSAGSQFFIMHGTTPGLDGQYTAFGHVIEGMDVVDKIASVRTGPNPMMPNENSKPLEWVTLKSVKIMSRAAAMGGGAKAAAGEKAAAAGEKAGEKTEAAKATGKAKAADAAAAAAAKASQDAAAAKAAADHATSVAKEAAGGAPADTTHK